MADYGDKRGVAVLRDPTLNKSTAFTMDEREQLGLRGLLPPTVNTQQQQLNRILTNIRRKDHDHASRWQRAEQCIGSNLF